MVPSNADSNSDHCKWPVFWLIKSRFPRCSDAQEMLNSCNARIVTKICFAYSPIFSTGNASDFCRNFLCEGCPHGALNSRSRRDPYLLIFRMTNTRDISIRNSNAGATNGAADSESP